MGVWPLMVLSQSNIVYDSLNFELNLIKKSELPIILMDSNTTDLNTANIHTFQDASFTETSKVEFQKQLNKVKNEFIESGNLNPSFYWMNPSAIPLKRNGYYRDLTYLLLNQQFALSDNLSIGLASSLFLIPFGLNIKYSKQLFKYMYVGTGIRGFIFNPIERVNAAYGYGNLTIGSPEYNFTINGGYGHFNDLYLPSENDAYNGFFYSTAFSTYLKLDDSRSFVIDAQYFEKQGADVIFAVAGFNDVRSESLTVKIGLASMVVNRSRLTGYDYYKNTDVYTSDWYSYWLPFLGVSYVP